MKHNLEQPIEYPNESFNNQLSIDIGKKNLGYSIFDGSNLRFGIFDITYHIKKNRLKENMEGRNKILLTWLKKLHNKYRFDKIIVEKQVIRNVVAMCIQSCIISFGFMNNIPVESYDPKNKFVFTGDTYNSAKKEHKRLAIKYASNLLKTSYPDKLEYFNTFQKQDDISDSILMNFLTHPETDLKTLKTIITN